MAEEEMKRNQKGKLKEKKKRSPPPFHINDHRDVLVEVLTRLDARREVEGQGERGEEGVPLPLAVDLALLDQLLREVGREEGRGCLLPHFLMPATECLVILMAEEGIQPEFGEHNKKMAFGDIDLLIWFIAVIHAILSAGKKLQQLYLEKDESKNKQFLEIIVKSSLLRRLILTASSSSMISHAAKMLSLLNKEAADKGDLQNLFISSDDQFPEVFNAHTAVRLAEEKLDSLIDIFRRQLRLHNLEFVSVSGSTHLIEVIPQSKATFLSSFKVLWC